LKSKERKSKELKKTRVERDLRVEKRRTKEDSANFIEGHLDMQHRQLIFRRSLSRAAQGHRRRGQRLRSKRLVVPVGVGGG